MSWLIVGLGNPGSIYSLTRHNMGFLVLDRLANRLNISFKRERAFKGSIAECQVAGQDLILLKPETFMNLSGDALSKVIKERAIDVNRLIVVHDEAWLPFKRLRLKLGGGAGGHNGLKSIDQALQSQDYIRLRMGISPENSAGEAVPPNALHEFVLEPFTHEEQIALPEFIKRGEEVILRLLEEPFPKVVEATNRGCKINEPPVL